MLTFGQFTQLQGADGDPLQSRNLMADPRKNASDLTIAAFFQNHFKYCTGSARFLDLNARSFGLAFRQAS